MTWSVIIQKDKNYYQNTDRVKQRLRQTHKPEQLLHLPHEQRQQGQESPQRPSPILSPPTIRAQSRLKRLKKFHLCLLKDHFTKERNVVHVFKGVRKLNCKLNSISIREVIQGQKYCWRTWQSKSLQTQKSKFRPSPRRLSMLLRPCHYF